MVPSCSVGCISNVARPFSTVTFPHAVFESHVAVSCASGVIVRLNGSATPQCPGVTVPVHVPARALIPPIGALRPDCIEAQPAEKTMVVDSSIVPCCVMSDHMYYSML